MDREEFENTNHFGEDHSCATCWWASAFRETPIVWRCRLMQELGVSEADSVITKPEEHSCGRYEP
jgi:hypothetical protein